MPVRCAVADVKSAVDKVFRHDAELNFSNCKSVLCDLNGHCRAVSEQYSHMAILRWKLALPVSCHAPMRDRSDLEAQLRVGEIRSHMVALRIGGTAIPMIASTSAPLY